MERLHSIFANHNVDLKAFLDLHGIEHEFERSIVGETVSLVIAESHPSWPDLARHLAVNSDLLHTVGLRYSAEEISQAGFCEFQCAGQFGYPQPEAAFGYQNITYYPSIGCRSCGIGLRQVDPFRFKKPPTQRHSHVVQLNWVFDEFFLSERARLDLEGSGLTGFRIGPAVLHKSGEPLHDWYQLHIDAQLPGVIDTSTFTKELCGQCGRTKYNHPTDRQIEVRLDHGAAPDISRSPEWFGSGGSAWRSTMVSKKFVNYISSRKWRGVNLAPVLVR
ncbi:MAG TPA: hypothetical protein PLB89_00390 [Flavobacteriales bacterium]|nr:hypothetical protein [Flavobacteriales bacterium]